MDCMESHNIENSNNSFDYLVDINLRSGEPSQSSPSSRNDSPSHDVYINRPKKCKRIYFIYILILLMLGGIGFYMWYKLKK